MIGILTRTGIVFVCLIALLLTRMCFFLAPLEVCLLTVLLADAVLLLDSEILAFVNFVQGTK